MRRLHLPLSAGQGPSGSGCRKRRGSGPRARVGAVRLLPGSAGCRPWPASGHRASGGGIRGRPQRDVRGPCVTRRPAPCTGRPSTAVPSPARGPVTRPDRLRWPARRGRRKVGTRSVSRSFVRPVAGRPSVSVTRRADAPGAGNGESIALGSFPAPPTPARPGLAAARCVRRGSPRSVVWSRPSGYGVRSGCGRTGQGVARAVLAGCAHRAGDDLQLAVHASAVLQFRPVRAYPGVHEHRRDRRTRFGLHGEHVLGSPARAEWPRLAAAAAPPAPAGGPGARSQAASITTPQPAWSGWRAEHAGGALISVRRQCGCRCRADA